MRRALALLTATAGWVVVIQLVIGTSPPPPEFAVEGLSNPLVMGLVDSQTTHKSLVGVERSAVTTTSTTTTSTTTTTTTTTAPTTTTAAPKPTTTTTAAPRQSTTTSAPKPTTSTTAAPTTTAPPETTTTTEASGNFSSGAESDFIKRINNLRASEGLDALAVSSSLKSYARDWSEEMAQSGEFRHSNLQAYITTTNWSTIGENIGKGGSVSAIFNALVDSSPHLANMLNSDFTHIGVGVYIDADGVLWTTHVFGG